MSQRTQTPESIESDFDRIALLSNEDWNHNTHYHKFLLKHLPEDCGQVLEIGCGAGNFSRMLAQRAEKVLAIDLSAQMIHLAKSRANLYPNIDFVKCDVVSYDLRDNQFDCIATLTTMHHLPMMHILKKIKKALKPGGIFLCIDLYKRSNLGDLIFDFAAYPADLFLRLIKTGNLRLFSKERQAYAEHGKTDTYLTMQEIKNITTDILPGAKLSRHLFWRYSIVWKKGIDNKI